jgi:hypothetical protein
VTEISEFGRSDSELSYRVSYFSGIGTMTGGICLEVLPIPKWRRAGLTQLQLLVRFRVVAAGCSFRKVAAGYILIWSHCGRVKKWPASRFPRFF